MRSLRLNQGQVQAMIAHVVATAPHEACGLIGGTGDKAARIIPIKNIAADPIHHYEMDAGELLQAHKLFEANNLNWLGVYHSHVSSDALPSPEDIRVATLHMPKQVQVIISLKDDTPRLQAWHIHQHEVDAVELLIGRERSQAVPLMTRTEIWAVMIALALGVVLLLVISLSLLPPAPPLPPPQ